MKRMYILIALSLVNATSPAQVAHFQVKFSEPLAVFQFLDDLSANAPQNVFKTAFESSPSASTSTNA